MRMRTTLARTCGNNSALKSRLGEFRLFTTSSLFNTTYERDVVVPAVSDAHKSLSAKSLNKTYYHGEIIHWNPYERRGAIRDCESKEIFAIANSFAFETILPTSMPALEGVKVTFTKHSEPSKAQVIVRYRNEPITAESYHSATPPVSLLDDCIAASVKDKVLAQDELENKQKVRKDNGFSDEQVKKEEQINVEEKESIQSLENTSGHPDIDPTSIVRYAADIVVDLNSISHTQLCRFDGPLVRMEGVAPTSNIKDLRNSRLFDRATKDYLRYKRILGSDDAARDACARQQAQERAQEEKCKRIIVQREVCGTITAWSPLHRSGVIVKTENLASAQSNMVIRENNENKLNQAIQNKSAKCKEHERTDITLKEASEHNIVDNNATHTNNNSSSSSIIAAAKDQSSSVCIIRNAFSFASALPTSTNLVGKTVTFVEVVYPIRPLDHYAEEICINGPHVFDAALPSVEEVQTKLIRDRKAEQLVRQHKARGMVIMDMETDSVKESYASTPSHGQQNSSIEQEKQNRLEEQEQQHHSNTYENKENLEISQQSSEECAKEESHYGVIIRWSGGSGVVQSEVNQQYEIPSSAQFDTLMSNVHRHTHHICGAVVKFKVNATQPHVACAIEVLSTPESNEPSTLRSQAERVHARIRDEYETPRLSSKEWNNANTNKNNNEHYIYRNVKSREKKEDKKEEEKEQAERVEEQDSVLVHHGVIKSWFAEERQGIINGEDGNHYVIRDAAEDVLNYKTQRKSLRSGVSVKFVTNGTDSRLALQIEILATNGNNADDDSDVIINSDRAEESNETGSEAIASPLSVNYWLQRMERVGLNVKDVRDRQGKALTINEFIADDDDEDDDDDDDDNSSASEKYDAHLYAKEGYASKRVKMQRQKQSKQSSNKKVDVKEKVKLQDTLTLLKSDPWWNDSRRNIKLGDSDVTAGTLAMLSPAAALNTALSINTPKKLNKMVKKFQSKLTEEQKAIAWEQAKEQAPLFVKFIKEERERDDDKTTYWF